MDLTPVAAIVEQDARIIAVYALGSVVGAGLRPDSDVDLALMLAHGAELAATELAALSERLTAVLGRTVDLGVLSARNLVYARQAFLTGQPIYARSASAAPLMVATWLGLYTRYQEDRQEVLRAYST